jgi:SAM-dependent methyltransferase
VHRQGKSYGLGVETERDGPEAQRFVPALGLRVLNPLFDPLIRLHMRERLFKGRLIDRMEIRPGHRILDIWCGTGTLAMLIKERHPESEVVGLDPDSRILEIAERKAARAGVKIQLDVGYADRLPYADASFERVTSSLVFHHLMRETKRAALREVHRVPRPGGELHVADFGPARNLLMRIAIIPVLLVDGADRLRDNVAGRLPEFMNEAGFTDVAEAESFTTRFGPVWLYRARKPG